ncbi:MAG: hypothetical protein ACKVUS_21945 [Saprospiraceae bacterium]
MGITISYRGRLRRKQDIQTLTNEVKDLCKSANWDYETWDDGMDGKPLYGITFKIHPDSEGVWMTFNKEGMLHDFFSIDRPVEFLDEDGYHWNYTKTQFAGVETHIVTCKLLRFLGEKYFEDWKVEDDGLYYETGDTKYLTQVMDFLNDAINDFSESLEDIPVKEGDSLTEHLTSIMQRFALRNPPPTPPDMARK